MAIFCPIILLFGLCMDLQMENNTYKSCVIIHKFPRMKQLHPNLRCCTSLLLLSIFLSPDTMPYIKWKQTVDIIRIVKHVSLCLDQPWLDKGTSNLHNYDFLPDGGALWPRPRPPSAQTKVAARCILAAGATFRRWTLATIVVVVAAAVAGTE